LQNWEEGRVMVDWLAAGGFLIVLYVGGTIFESINASLLGELLVGAIMGPHGLNAIPEVDALRLIGEIGLSLLVFEGGLAVDVSKVRSIGMIAMAIAITGTILPLLIGWGLLVGLGYGTKEGLAAGTALSSTSIGMATRLLQANGRLETSEGLLITVAAMVDDIASLVILAMLDAIAGSNPKAWDYCQPIVASIGIALCAPLLMKLAPFTLIFLDYLQAKLPSLFESAYINLRTLDASSDSETEERKQESEKRNSRDMVVFYYLLISFLLLLGMTTAAEFAGTTPLLGAFVAGVSVSGFPEFKRAWEKGAEVQAAVATSLFFAAIGTYVPLAQMFHPKSLGIGLLYFIPAVVGKWVTGFYAWNECGGWVGVNVVGWAMVGRGELGFVMAASALKSDLLDHESFAVTVWALLLATLVAPIMFSRCLEWRERITRELVENKSVVGVAEEKDINATVHVGSVVDDEDAEEGLEGLTEAPISVSEMGKGDVHLQSVGLEDEKA